MSSQELQRKYSFRFTMEPKRSDADSPEPSKAEVQEYINELLGLMSTNKPKPHPNNSNQS